MKDYLNQIKIKLNLIRASIVYTFQIETAYAGNNWGGLISTIMYTLTYLLFLEIIYSNVDSIAGYSRDEMLLFVLMGQLWVYAILYLIQPNVDSMIRSVNNGAFDLTLAKPVNSLFYVMIKYLQLFSILRDAVVPLLALIFAINWSNIELTSTSVLFGGISFFIGVFISSSIYIIASLPAFLFGQSSEVIGVVFEGEYNAGNLFPLQGWSKSAQVILITLIPFGIASGLSTSLMLGKIDQPLTVLGVIFLVALVFNKLRGLAWQYALRNYTSASS